MPRLVVGLGLLVGVFGFGAYLKSSSGTSEAQLVRQQRKFIEQPANSVQTAPIDKTVTPSGTANFISPQGQEMLSKAPVVRTEIRSQEPQRPLKFQAEQVEEVYFCGASTAKGTPCKHRVKGNVRCFQHVGMPAMLPPDQLRIK